MNTCKLNTVAKTCLLCEICIVLSVFLLSSFLVKFRETTPSQLANYG